MIQDSNKIRRGFISIALFSGKQGGFPQQGFPSQGFPQQGGFGSPRSGGGSGTAAGIPIIFYSKLH